MRKTIKHQFKGQVCWKGFRFTNFHDFFNFLAAKEKKQGVLSDLVHMGSLMGKFTS